MGFEFVPWTDEKLATELARYPHIDTKLTANPEDWTFEIIPADGDEPTMFFFKFKKGKWDAWVPFDFKQDGKNILFDTEMELFATEFSNEEDDADAFSVFLEDVGFTEDY